MVLRRLFTRRNRSILELLKSTDRNGRHSPGSNPPPSHFGDDGFDNDHDIELPRDIAEDFCVSNLYILTKCYS